jgi:large subunit ribosomal protein L10
MDGQVLDAAQATGLADLESREEMLSKIAGLLKADMARAARLFVAAQSRFLSLLEAYKEKVPAGDAPAEAADEGEASADSAEAADSAEPAAADTGTQPEPDADTDTQPEPDADTETQEA